MARKSANGLRLQAGQLVSGKAPVGSIQEVRANGRDLGYGRVDRPTSKQQAANRKAGIPLTTATHEKVQGFWGKG